MTMMPLDEVAEESEQAEANDINQMCNKLTVGLNMLSSQDKYHKQQSFANGDHYKVCIDYWGVIGSDITTVGLEFRI